MPFQFRKVPQCAAEKPMRSDLPTIVRNSLFCTAILLAFVPSVARSFSQETVGASELNLKDRLQQKAEQFFEKNDSDKDGKLSKDEFPSMFRAFFARVDRDSDGFVTLKEDVAFRLSRRKPGEQVENHTSRTVRDIVYAKAGDVDLKLDVYIPKKPAEPMPVVVWIHGGGWKNGSKGGGGRAAPLLQRGYAIVDVDYRLSGVAIFPAAVKDCRAAVRWVKANATTYGWDSNRVAVMGSSAGGHLAAFIGTASDQDEFDTTDHAEQSDRVQAVVDLWGPTDFLQMDEFSHKDSRLIHDSADSPESRFLGGPIQDEPYRSIAAKANPITYVSKDDPPFLIIHGDQDLSVPVHQSELLHKALESAGVEVTLHVEKGDGHGLKKTSRKPEFINRIAEFLDRHLKAIGPVPTGHFEIGR